MEAATRTAFYHIPEPAECDGMDLDDILQIIRDLSIHYPEIEKHRVKFSALGKLNSLEAAKTFLYNMRYLPEVEKMYLEYKTREDERDPVENAAEIHRMRISEIKNNKVYPKRQAFAEVICEKFVPVSFNNQTFVYQDGIYVPDGGRIRSYITEQIRAFKPYTFEGDLSREIREISTYIRGMTFCPEYPFDKALWCIPVKNGVIEIDPDTGSHSLHPHDPKYRFSRKIPVSYDPGADPSFVRDTFNSWVGEDNASYLIQIAAIPLLQTWRGSQKIAYLLEGQPDAGKTTFCEFLYAFFGKGGYSEIDLLRLMLDRFAFAGLEGRFINISDDLESIPIKAVGTFKKLSGSSFQRVERKGQDGYETLISASHVFSCNAPPIIKREYDDPAFWSRWVYLIFDNQFERDDTFKERLFSENNLSAFLNLIISELIRMVNDPKQIRRMDAEQVKGLWVNAADMISAFISEHFEIHGTGGIDESGQIDSGWWISKDDVFSAYLKFCTKSGSGARTKNSLTTALSRHGINTYQLSRNGRRSWGYIGIRWRSGKSPVSAGAQEALVYD